MGQVFAFHENSVGLHVPKSNISDVLLMSAGRKNCPANNNVLKEAVSTIIGAARTVCPGDAEFQKLFDDLLQGRFIGVA